MTHTTIWLTGWLAKQINEYSHLSNQKRKKKTKQNKTYKIDISSRIFHRYVHCCHLKSKRFKKLKKKRKRKISNNNMWNKRCPLESLISNSWIIWLICFWTLQMQQRIKRKEKNNNLVHLTKLVRKWLLFLLTNDVNVRLQRKLSTIFIACSCFFFSMVFFFLFYSIILYDRILNVCNFSPGLIQTHHS